MTTEELDCIAITICEKLGVDLPNLNHAADCFKCGFYLAQQIQRQKELRQTGIDKSNQ